MVRATIAPIAKRTLATVAESTPVQTAVRPAFGTVRHDWRRSEIQKIFDGPLMDTIFKAVSTFVIWNRVRHKLTGLYGSFGVDDVGVDAVLTPGVCS